MDPPTDDVNTVHDELLDSETTEDEVRKAIRRLKSGKAAGADQVINEFLKSTERVILPFLVKLCNASFNQGIFPEEWTKSIIVPLHKKGDCDNPDNYRGISLLSSFSKVCVLNARLTEWAEENTVFTEAQAGFRKGYSTTDHIFTLHAIIEKQFSRNAKLYVAFVDFYKAFDTVSHTMMWLVLSRTGIQGKMLTMLRAMYASIKACVRCNGSELSDYFECLQGLKQGCLCSPILFTYFINELANDITRGGIHGIQLMPNQIEMFLMLFADDLALLSSTVRGLQNQLNLLYESSRRLGLKVNTDKTKIMVFRKGGHLSSRENWYLGEQTIEIVGKYKYLGFNFSTMLSYNIGTEDFVSRAKKGTIEILKALRTYGCYSCSVFFKLFDAQIVPSLLYAAEIWGHRENKQIEKVHLYACKLFINVPTVTPNDMIYGELGRYPLYIEAAAKCIQYWFRVLKQPASRYSKMAYQSLLTLHEKGHENWVTYVKSLLCKCDYGFVWLFGGVGDEKLFLRDFKERLRQNFTQDWFSHLSQSTRFEMYHCFKSVIGREEYLDLIKVNIYRTALARFRLGMSPFNAHRLRYSLSEANRACPFCPDKVEDEAHVLFDCFVYGNIRNVYINKAQNISLQEQVLSVLKCTDESSVVALGKYLFLAVQIRKKRLQSGAYPL